MQSKELYRKYIIAKSNGEPLESSFDGFVLRLDSNGDKAHVKASIKALMTYANEIEPDLPELAQDLRKQYSPLLKECYTSNSSAKEIINQRNVEVLTEIGLIPVPATNYCIDIPYMAVTMLTFGQFDVTHTPSGRRIMGGFERSVNAINAMLELQLAINELGVDISGDYDAFHTELDDKDKQCKSLNGLTIKQWINLNTIHANFHCEFPWEDDQDGPFTVLEKLLEKLAAGREVKMKPVKVQRDEYGMWVHPELPEWGENISSEQVEAWFVSQGLTHHLVLMDGELGERWCNDELESYAEWEPKPKVKDSFLVGIWDSEDGVVAMFASPLIKINPL